MKRPIVLCITTSLLIVIVCKPGFTDASMNGTVPKGKILTLEGEEGSNLLELESRAGNKSQKILTRPINKQTTTTTTPYNPYFMNPHYPQYQQQYPQYPGNPGPGYIPGGGDSSAQGSGMQANVQRPPPNANNYPNNNHGNPAAVGQKEEQPPSGIPDIYVQLVGAIEKLVGRMDKLDNRLRTVENILYHMTNKKEELPEQGSCPNNFRKVEGVRGKCYQISSYTKSPMIYDWKSAENECTKVGGRLVEMLNYEDFLRVSQFLIKYSSASNSATSDYWIGGINPGLIWIWAESGQPVEMNKRFWNDNDNSSTLPGCLKLSYSHRLNTYFFKHSPCGHSQNYICEIMDNTVSRALAHFEEQLWNESDIL